MIGTGPRRDAEFDLVVFGASGFTGRLICERLVERGPEKRLRWAMAGRNEEKLAAVRKDIGAEDAGLIVANSDNPASLDAMAARTRAVIAAAGPFQLYGSAVVAACVANDTDYLDLSGEVVWMRRMIDAHAETMERGGARILFSCGFDSVPFELGVLFLQSTAYSRFGVPVPRAKGRVRRMVGRFSGGTAASGRATRATAKREPEVATLLQDPFCLTPGFEGPAQPDLDQVAFDDDLGAWTAPFVMAPINSRNIHRSHALQGHRW
ncbi:MAG: Saccharopine dehydrogenase, partial [uncultured Sphingomonadaceae bacterium]